jgi:molecular chaperone GrpE
MARQGAAVEAGAAPPSPAEQSELEASELLDLLRRERADFVNYRHRLQQERAGDRQAAQATVLEQLLPLLDDLDRAMERLPKELEEHPWARGVALSRDRLRHAFEELGLSRVGHVGEPFDPAIHEALFYDVRPDEDDRRVIEVIRPGYRLGDRLLRPAQVGVAGPPEDRPDARGAPPAGRRDAAPAGHPHHRPRGG